MAVELTEQPGPDSTVMRTPSGPEWSLSVKQASQATQGIGWPAAAVVADLGSGTLGRGRSLVGDEVAVHDVGQLPLEASESLRRRLVLAELAAVIGTPGGVVADLAQGSDVQGAVELAVTQAAKAVTLEVPAGHLDGGGAVVGGEVAGRGEAGDITDVADDQGGDDWTDSADLGQGRGARLDRGAV